MSILLILSCLTLQAKAEIIGKIEAHVGSRIITSYDVEMLNPAVYKQILSISDSHLREEQMDAYKEQALNFLIDMNIMEIAAEREGIKISEKDVDRAVAEIAAGNKLSTEQFIKALSKEGLSLKQYRYQIKSQMIMRSKISMPQIVITDSDIKNMIDEEGDTFGLKDKYKIKIIVTQTKSELNKIIKLIKKGEPFDEAARKYSLDPSAADGGQLGFKDVTYMPVEMEQALEKSKIGSLTKPFKYEDKWAVCFIEDFKSKYDIDIAEREKIKAAIGEKLFKKAADKWIAKSRESIVVFKAADKFKVQ